MVGWLDALRNQAAQRQRTPPVTNHGNFPRVSVGTFPAGSLRRAYSFSDDPHGTPSSSSPSTPLSCSSSYSLSSSYFSGSTDLILVIGLWRPSPSPWKVLDSAMIQVVGLIPPPARAPAPSPPTGPCPSRCCPTMRAGARASTRGARPSGGRAIASRGGRRRPGRRSSSTCTSPSPPGPGRRSSAHAAPPTPPCSSTSDHKIEMNYRAMGSSMVQQWLCRTRCRDWRRGTWTCLKVCSPRSGSASRHSERSRPCCRPTMMLRVLCMPHETPAIATTECPLVEKGSKSTGP